MNKVRLLSGSRRIYNIAADKGNAGGIKACRKPEHIDKAVSKPVSVFGSRL